MSQLRHTLKRWTINTLTGQSGLRTFVDLVVKARHRADLPLKVLINLLEALAQLARSTTRGNVMLSGNWESLCPAPLDVGREAADCG